MMARYRLDPPRSRFTLQAFATGLLSAFAHSPSFAVRDFDGVIRYDGGALERMALELTVQAGSLELEGRASESDRREIEGRMRDEVLETSRFCEIAYRAAAVEVAPLAPGRYRLRLGGELRLHGVNRRHQLDAELIAFEDGLRLRGDCPLRMSDYGIRPVTALGGTIRLRDDLRVAFDIGALPEGP
jgi:polyisoprenoid-binding protein YceI